MAVLTIVRNVSDSQISSLLSQSAASSTYLTLAAAESLYLTNTSASTNYLKQSSASSTYLTSANASASYLTQSSASSTYLTQSSASTTYSNTSTYQPTYRNRLYNGDMRIFQRATASSVTASYTLDRWYASGYGQSGGITVTQSTATPPTGIRYFQRVAQASATTTNFFITQSLETDAVVPLQGKTVTLSFKYRNSVNMTNVWNAAIYTSTATDTGLFHPGITRTTAGTKALTNSASWVSDSLTVTIPSNATSLAVSFETTNSTVNGSQFDFTGVQLEIGSTASAFEERPTGVELELCQRYYVNGGQIHSGYLASAVNAAAAYNNHLIFFPTPMRVAPSVSLSFSNIDNSTNGGVQGITPRHFEHLWRYSGSSWEYCSFTSSYTATAEL